MANFTYASACARAVAKVADGTWINAFVCLQTTGAGVAKGGSGIAVRLQRKMSHTNPDYGGYVEVTDDGTS